MNRGQASQFCGRGVVVEDGVEVAEVLDKIIRALQPLVGTEAEPVRDDNIPLVFEFINDELKGDRDVHPVVQ